MSAMKRFAFNRLSRCVLCIEMEMYCLAALGCVFVSTKLCCVFGFEIFCEYRDVLFYRYGQMLFLVQRAAVV